MTELDRILQLAGLARRTDEPTPTTRVLNESNRPLMRELDAGLREARHSYRGPADDSKAPFKGAAPRFAKKDSKQSDADSSTNEGFELDEDEFALDEEEDGDDSKLPFKGAAPPFKKKSDKSKESDATNEAALREKSPPGFKGTVKAMKKHKDIDNPYALAWWEKNKGMKSHRKKDGSKKKNETIESGVNPVSPRGVNGAVKARPSMARPTPRPNSMARPVTEFQDDFERQKKETVQRSAAKRASRLMRP